MFDIFEIYQLASPDQQFELVFSLQIVADIHCIHCRTLKINNNLPYLSIAYIIYISYYIFLKLFFFTIHFILYYFSSFLSFLWKVKLYNRYECFYIISRFSSSFYFLPEKKRHEKNTDYMQWQTPTAAASAILLFMLSLDGYGAFFLQASSIMKIYC